MKKLLLSLIILPTMVIALSLHATDEKTELCRRKNDYTLSYSDILNNFNALQALMKKTGFSGDQNSFCMQEDVKGLSNFYSTYTFGSIEQQKKGLR